MKGHIKSVRLVNIQSWEDEAMKFSSDITNVIIGRSETGKSVVFKVIRQMCFSNFHKRKGRKSLIRRGYDNGAAVFEMYSGAVIIFQLYKTYQTYSLIKDGESRSWKQNELPEEIQQEFGWYIDKSENIILNLIDLEVPMPFVDSTPQCDARTLAFVTENPDLERTLINLRELEKEASELYKTQEVNVRVTRSNYELLDYKDTLTLKTALSSVERKMEVFEKLVNIHEPINELKDLKRPKALNVDHQKVLNGMKSIEVISNVTRDLKQLMRMKLKSLPQIDENLVKERLTQIAVIQSLKSKLEELRNLKSPEFNLIDAEKVIRYLILLDKVAIVKDLLAELANVPKLKFEFLDEDKIETDLGKIDKAASLLKKLNSLKYLKVETDKSAMRIRAVTKQILELENKLGVCPTCGNEFKNSHKHDNVKEGS